MIVPAVVLPYHGQEVRDDRPISGLQIWFRCAYCGARLTKAEESKLPRDTFGSESTPLPMMQCDDCHAGEVAALLPFV
jgi:hypothetical protein